MKNLLEERTDEALRRHIERLVEEVPDPDDRLELTARLSMRLYTVDASAGERANEIRTPTGSAYVISAEDLLVDRLRAFVYWKSMVDGVNALLLLRTVSNLDRAAVESKVESEPDLARTLRELAILDRELSRSQRRPETELGARLRAIMEGK